MPPAPESIDRRRALLRVALAALLSRAIVVAAAALGALHPRADLARATAHADRSTHPAGWLLAAATLLGLALPLAALAWHARLATLAAALLALYAFRFARGDAVN